MKRKKIWLSVMLALMMACEAGGIYGRDVNALEIPSISTQLVTIPNVASTGGSFSRQSNNIVEFAAQIATQETKADIDLELINRLQIKHQTSVTLDATHTTVDTTLNNVTVNRGAIIGVNVRGKNLKTQEYTLVKSDTGSAPTLPYDTEKWTNLGPIPEQKLTWKSLYPDIDIDKQGYISTKHYNYKYGSTTLPKQEIPARKDTFGYPIGDTLVYQKATVDSDDQYHSTKEASAFFSNSATGYTDFTVDFTPEESGKYQFGVYGNGGAKGNIEVDGRLITIVQELDQYTDNAYIHTKSNVCDLKEDVAYKITMKWKHKSNTHVVPSLQYRKTTNGSDGSWKLIPAESLSNEAYVGGANKAVKFWGYIVPDATEEYNFAAYADDGAYGYIIVNGKEVKFVENWNLERANNRHDQVGGSDINIYLEKGMPYPIYMEWYEGEPVDKAFIPRYKLKGESDDKFRNIPSTWFYPSKNETPGAINDAYFEPVSVGSKIPLGEEVGTYYIVLKLTDLSGKSYETSYGPIEITANPLQTKGGGDKNKIVPASISNIYWEMQYGETSKNITYSLDIGALVADKFDGENPIATYDLTEAAVNIEDENGRIDKSYYKIDKNDSNILTIRMNDDYQVEANTIHKISVFIPTKMGEQVQYNKYLNDIYKTKQQVNVYQTAKEVYYEQNIVNDKKEEKEASTAVEHNETIDVLYWEIPKVS